MKSTATSAYPLTQELLLLADSLQLPEWFRVTVIHGWFQEYEHGTADPKDITPRLSLSRLAAFTARLMKHMAKNFPATASFQEVRDGLGCQLESNELHLGSSQEAILDDLFLSIES